MARSKLLALALAASMMIAPAQVKAGVIVLPIPANSTPVAGYALAGCVAGIILAAIDASRRFNRELTAAEAASCGLLYWINLANRP